MSQITVNTIFPETKRYPIMFYTANQDYSQENIIDRVLGRHQILIVLDGSGSLIYNGTTYKLKRGCAFYTAAKAPHSYINEGGLRCAFITALGPAADALAEELVTSGMYFTDNANIENMASEISQIIKLYNNGKDQGTLSTLTYSFFVDFLSKQKSDVPEWLENITKYIHIHLSEKLTLEKLAGVAFISVSKLCHGFKNYYSVSVFDYIIDIRLQHARDLLKASPKITTKEVAGACGFSDIGYFCKLYRKKYEKTPTEEKTSIHI